MSEPAPFAYEGLDRVIHERARLGILTSLASNPKGLVFGDLRRLCGLTDGNLSRHLRCCRRPARPGDQGLRAQPAADALPDHARGPARFLEYLEVLDKVVREAAAAAKAQPGEGPLPGLAPA